jgi:ribonuclease P protein subunit RPR2
MVNNSKIALERIYRLFELAEEMQKSKREDKKELIKRYLSLAKRIGERTNVSIPKEMKKKFCKKCFSMNIKTKEEAPFLITECKDCGFKKKYSLKAKE